MFINYEALIFLKVYLPVNLFKKILLLKFCALHFCRLFLYEHLVEIIMPGIVYALGYTSILTHKLASLNSSANCRHFLEPGH